MLHKIWFRASKDAYYLQIDRTHQKRLGKTKEEAEANYRKWLIEQEGILPEPEQRKFTIAELAQEFLNYAQAETKPKTYAFYCYFVCPFVERFGGTVARDFQPLAFTKWLNEHKGWKGSRRAAIVSVQRLFTFAVENKLLKESPLAGYKKPARNRRKRFLSADERDFLLAAIRDRFFREYCFALMNTGARPMEVGRVTAADVSDDGTMWIFEEHKTDSTGEDRVIYLTPAMQELTGKLMAEHPTGPLFRSTRRKQGIRTPWTRNGIRCRFKRIREKYPQLAGVSAYTLRHSFATLALLNGVPAPIVSSLMGHTQLKTLDEYNKVGQARSTLKEAIKKAAGDA